PGGRLGWPAPQRPVDAIDEAEYDLALLAGLRDADPATTDGSARYLLDANVHLGRALRARGRRWLRRWTPADGLVDPDALAREALADHQLGARPFAPTALQHFAGCPYRFFLEAVMRLQPREEPVASAGLDPPQADPASVPDPVPVIGDLRLRGSVDLVERRPPGVLRATDHKTAKTRPKTGVVVGGGTVLQPLLYALACERLLREPVEAGRLYYCTADGGYEERVVPLDAEGRRVAGEVVEIIGRALGEGFLPAMPDRGACRYC